MRQREFALFVCQQICVKEKKNLSFVIAKVVEIALKQQICPCGDSL